MQIVQDKAWSMVQVLYKSARSADNDVHTGIVAFFVLRWKYTMLIKYYTCHYKIRFYHPLESALCNGLQKSWPLLPKKYMEAGVMTFVAHCIDT